MFANTGLLFGTSFTMVLQSLICQRRPSVVNRRQLFPRIICSAALRAGPPAESQGFLCFDPDSKVLLLLIDIQGVISKVNL